MDQVELTEAQRETSSVNISAIDAESVREAFSRVGAGAGEGDDQGATWVVDMLRDGVHLTRMHNGFPCESYRAVSPAEAVIWLAAVIQGYQPPRDLRRLDKPVG